MELRTGTEAVRVATRQGRKVVLGRGPDGDNLIHEAVVAMYDHGTLEPIAGSVHIHPTLSEAVKSAAKRTA